MLEETKLKPAIFARITLDVQEEFDIAGKIIKVYDCRSMIPIDSIVVGRYSVLPYYKELEKDLYTHYSKLINSYEQHNFCADIFEWYNFFKDYTPKTWHNLTEVPFRFNGPFVIKGITNSRKQDWNRRMYAANRSAVHNVINSLLDDTFISEQGLCIREYIPLKTFFTSINGLPITNEYRFFCFGTKILSSGFYWSSCLNDLKGENLHTPPEATKFVKNLLNLLKRPINFPKFFVLDVAQTATNDWILIEVNDGQMSGLSENSPYALYSNLLTELNLEA